MPRRKPTRSWNREIIIQAIQTWRRKGVGQLQIKKKDRKLYAQAAKYFHGWHNALRAAGWEPGRQSWSKEIVVAKIQDRVRQGRSVSKVHQEDACLYSQAKRLFGSWQQALQAAGVEPTWSLWTFKPRLPPSSNGHRVGDCPEGCKTHDQAR
jgi:hypothetical protein